MRALYFFFREVLHPCQLFPAIQPVWLGWAELNSRLDVGESAVAHPSIKMSELQSATCATLCLHPADQIISVCFSRRRTVCCYLQWLCVACFSCPSSCCVTSSLVSTFLSSFTTTAGSSSSWPSLPSLTDIWPVFACASDQSEKRGGKRWFCETLINDVYQLCVFLCVLNEYFWGIRVSCCCAGAFFHTRQKQLEPSWLSFCPWVWLWELLCPSSSKHWFNWKAHH